MIGFFNSSSSEETSDPNKATDLCFVVVGNKVALSSKLLLLWSSIGLALLFPIEIIWSVLQLNVFPIKPFRILGCTYEDTKPEPSSRISNAIVMYRAILVEFFSTSFQTSGSCRWYVQNTNGLLIVLQCQQMMMSHQVPRGSNQR